eukprot:gb/GEZN01020909.1/.p1 GENE.gb/GEZN01020909.1/~~gb/GEZN01020909.1/.p1  ORF type:complete len:117 (+),score=8.13 gb/GEZN01020909.1/:212-562(+)
MAQSLVTQVQNPDEVKAQPQPWWRAFCCCGSKPQQQETKQIPIPTQPPQREAGGEDGRQDQQWLLDPMEPEDAKRVEHNITLAGRILGHLKPILPSAQNPSLFNSFDGPVCLICLR